MRKTYTIENKFKAGFTLVELSIVLVIIGLLIGGILVGQSLISSARIQSQIRQFQQIDIAITLFEGKFRGLPGDSPYLNLDVGDIGDGDGIIENSDIRTASSNSTLGSYDEEIAFFWRHLQTDGFLAKEYSTFSTDASSGIRVGTHAPEAIVGGNTAITPYYVGSAGLTIDNTHRYFLADVSSTSDEDHGTSDSTASIPVIDIMAIDAKIDDGFAYVSNFNTYNAGTINTSSASSSCYTASGTHYSYDADADVNCFFWIDMKTMTTGSQ